MADLKNQRVIAAHILDVGLHRVWMNPEAEGEIAPAITRQDVKQLIENGIIKARPVKGVSRGRARKLDAKRAYGHRKGHGSRKGAKGARHPKKHLWMKKIRALRRRLHELKEENIIDRPTYCRMYRKAKGGEYRNVAHMEAHIESHKHGGD